MEKYSPPGITQTPNKGNKGNKLQDETVSLQHAYAKGQARKELVLQKLLSQGTRPTRIEEYD